jgi:di/tricarboxylate transporter
VTILALAGVLLSATLPAISIDFAALLGLCLLVLAGVLDTNEALAGFGNPTLLTVAGMFVLAEALHRTGAANGISNLVDRAGRRGSRTLMICLLPVVMVLSGVMSNTGVVVLLLPVMLGAAQRLKVSPSRLLLPLSYASITGGTLTLVGTTTTLLVDGILRQRGLPGLGLLEILPMGVVFCVLSCAYLVLAGPHLLPDRKGLTTPITPGTTREFMTEIVLAPSSRLVGQTLAQVPEFRNRVRVLQLVRGEEMWWPPFQDVRLESGDVLLVKTAPEELVRLMGKRGILGPSGSGETGRVAGVHMNLAEVMITPGSSLHGTTVSKAGMRERFGVLVLAVLRRGEHLRQKLGSLKLRAGDVLLIEGEDRQIQRLEHVEQDLIRLGTDPPQAPNPRKAPLAVALTSLALLAAAAGLAPLVIAVLLGSILAIGTGCLTSAQAYRAVNLRILLILGAMLAFGTAVQNTGLAASIATGLVAFGDTYGLHGVLATLYLATLILTELVTNAAAAGIMVPIALSMTERLSETHAMDVRYQPFVMAVALAASCSFLTPVGYQTNLLVYGPGGYKLQDYLRLGLPLSLLLWIAAVLVLPLVFPFTL